METAPSLTVTEREDVFRVLGFELQVRLKLASFRDKDHTHPRDMIEVSLLDRPWLGRLPPELAARLHGLLENPEG